MVSIVELSDVFLIVMLPLSTSTASEKLSTILLSSATAVALSAGDELLSVGAVVSPANWVEPPPPLPLVLVTGVVVVVSLVSVVSVESAVVVVSSLTVVGPVVSVVVWLVSGESVVSVVSMVSVISIVSVSSTLLLLAASTDRVSGVI